MIRQAILTDIPNIVAVNIKSWQQVYKGLIPDDILSNLSHEERIERWQAGFKNK
ncbi:hypothetical protein KJ966_18015 [bacterium]|nr:hypothetical protein [bacterium]